MTDWLIKKLHHYTCSMKDLTMYRQFNFMITLLNVDFPRLFLIFCYQSENVPSNLHTDLIRIN